MGIEYMLQYIVFHGNNDDMISMSSLIMYCIVEHTAT